MTKDCDLDLFWLGRRHLREPLEILRIMSGLWCLNSGGLFFSNANAYKWPHGGSRLLVRSYFFSNRVVNT